jgi:type IV pilus assembly protein PilW
MRDARFLPVLRQRGLSLAELLVAMALGLVVLLATGMLFIGANRAYASQAQAAEMDDAGRYALDALARAVRQSAHVDWAASQAHNPAAPAPVGGFDARSLPRASAGINGALPDAVNGSDVLALRYPGSGPGPDGDGATLDCAGFPVHGSEEGWSIFYVARNSQGEAELRCKYRGRSNWSADAVAGNVDGFQVLYGLDLNADGAPERYVNATAVATLDAALVLNGATPSQREEDLRRRTHWKRVVAVRVALLLHGPRLAIRPRSDAVHDLFGPDYADAAGASDPGARLSEALLAGREGARMRKVFTRTVALPAQAL